MISGNRGDQTESSFQEAQEDKPLNYDKTLYFAMGMVTNEGLETLYTSRVKGIINNILIKLAFNATIIKNGMWLRILESD